MSTAVGRETIERLMPRQNPQRRRVRLAPELSADVGVICLFEFSDVGGGQAPALQRKLDCS